MNDQPRDAAWRVRRLLCDWQMPEFLKDVTLDVDHFARKLAEVGAEAVCFTSKSAHGVALYPTAIGRMSPAVAAGNDFFGRVCDAVRARGVRFIAYFNVLLDYDTSGERAEWLQRDINGAPLAFENYPMFCMSCAPYLEWLTAYVAELAEKYGIDGIMFDIQYWHARGCFCRWCSEAFERGYGYPLEPAGFGAREWADFAGFQEKTRRDFILALKSAADTVRPNLEWSWNSSGNMSPDHELDAHLTCYGTEAHPPAYDLCSAKAKWMAASGKPYELWMPESIGSWGHHTVTTLATLKATSAVALAHGGGVTVNHAPVPAGDYGGRVFPAVYEIIGDLFSWIREREDLCRDAVSAADCAVLHSDVGTTLERTRRRAAAAGFEPLPELCTGQTASVASTALLDSIHVPFDFIHGEYALPGSSGRVGRDGAAPLSEHSPRLSPPRPLSDYRCLILPNVAPMSEETAAALRAYVAGGGMLVSTYSTSLYDRLGEHRDNFLLSDVLGVDFSGYSDYSIGYLDAFQPPLREALPEIPLLFKDTGYQQPGKNRPITCRLRQEAQALASITDPLIEADWDRQHHIFHDHSPQGTRTDRPGIVLNRFGNGVSVYICMPLLETYTLKPNPWHRAVLRGMLNAAGYTPTVVEVDAGSSIRVVPTRKDENYLIHLIRIRQETGGILVDPYGTDEVVCSVRLPFEPREIRELPADNPISWDRLPGEQVPGSGRTGGRRTGGRRNGHGLRFSAAVTDHSIIRISPREDR